MSDQTITLLILAAAVAVFVWNKLPVGSVALGVALALWATGVITIEEAVSGFGSTTVVLIASLFVVAEGLNNAGVTTWAGQMLASKSRGSKTRLLLMLMVIVAVLTAMITTNGSVAALVPMVVALAVQFSIRPSKVLMPLAFAAHAGSLLVLTASPVNVLTLEAARDSGAGEFNFFSFTLVGVPLLIGSIVLILLLSDRLLPDREPSATLKDLSGLPDTLSKQYLAEDKLGRFWASDTSRLTGKPIDRLNAELPDDLHLLGVQSGGSPAPMDAVLKSGDVLLVRGSEDGLRAFATEEGLSLDVDLAGTFASGLVTRDTGVAEVLIAPRSRYVGDEIYPGMVTESGKLVVFGARRGTEELEAGRTMRLEAGDALLLYGGWSDLETQTRDPDVILVDSPDAIRRQTVALGRSAWPALAILAGMVLLMSLDLVPPVVATLAAAIAMVLARVLTSEQAHRSINWPTLIIVGGMTPLSIAITQSGAAETISNQIVRIVGGGSPYVLLLGLFLVSAVLGQMISNTATALIILPIAVTVAADAGINPLAVLMCVNVAFAAAFLTPIATPANLMVMEPGGYQFGDYWKLGVVLLALYGVVAVLLVPQIWRF
jgi:di/tricarboxylate transporter